MVEVPAEYKDIADSAVRFGSIAVAQWGIQNFIMGRPIPLKTTMSNNAMIVAGLALFHLIVDKMVVRVVVKQGEEGFYHAMQLRK